MEDTKAKYCVVAIIDLLGFSNHLEVSGDLRTIIGQETIKRLRFLEEALDCLEKEKIKYPLFYPDNIYWTRINDALIFSLDLDDVLMPDIGETYRNAMTSDEWEKHFELSSIKEDEFDEIFSEKVRKHTRSVELFMGIISRVHNFINIKESQNHFPGVKSIVSSGFRRSFVSNHKEDILSANFAFSNAYLAESELKGCRLYADNNVLQLLTSNNIIRNILKLSCFSYRQNVFSPFNNQDRVFGLTGQYEETEIKEITLFRKKYYFRRLNQNPLTYLPLMDKILPEIKKIKSPHDNPVLYYRILNEFYFSDSESKIKTGNTYFMTLKVPFHLNDDPNKILQSITKKKKNF